MASMTITVPDAKATELITAYTPDYSATLSDGSPNPQTRAQFFRIKLANELKNTVLAYRRAQAMAGIDTSDPGITVT